MENHPGTACWRHLTAALLICVMTACVLRFAQGATGVAKLKFRAVELNADCKKVADAQFEEGAAVFPLYRLIGLSKCFLIRRPPDLVVEPEDVTHMVIASVPKLPRPEISSTPRTLSVKVEFTEKASERIRAYSRDRVASHIAVDVDGNVLTVATVAEPMGKSLVSGPA